MLTAVYVAANEGRNIAESMRSVKAYVDAFLVVDSIFPSNPDPHTHSSDQQWSQAARAADPKPLTYVQSDIKLTETEARNIALSHIEVGDWALIIDGDEMLTGNHDDVMAMVDVIRDCPFASVRMPVFTTAVLFDGDAPEMSPGDYATRPLISTSSFMVRFVLMVEGLHYELPSGHITPMLMVGDRVVGLDDPDSMTTYDAFLINRHATQPFEVYQNDYVWEMGSRAP